MLDYIDWKESYCYRQLIVRHVDDGQKWDATHLLHDDEAEFLSKLIKSYKSKKASHDRTNELLRMVPAMTKKCYTSIEVIHKEVLTENYWKLEYEKMRLNDPYIVTVVPRGFTTQALKVLTLENLLDKVVALKTLRREVKAFLELVH